MKHLWYKTITFRIRPVMQAVTCVLVLGGGGSMAMADAGTPASDSGQVAHTYEIPPQLSPEERIWFKVFQEGNYISRGWQNICAEILAKTPPEQRSMQQVALDNLGRKIGMEWARPNSVRKVTSSMLLEWGDILRQTARTNPSELSRAIASINQKVDAVLN